MSKIVKDGWREYHGMQLYIENGHVVYGQRDGSTTHPYKIVTRKSPAYPYETYTDGWDDVSGITYEAFKRLWREDKISMK